MEAHCENADTGVIFGEGFDGFDPDYQCEQNQKFDVAVQEPNYISKRKTRAPRTDKSGSSSATKSISNKKREVKSINHKVSKEEKQVNQEVNQLSNNLFQKVVPSGDIKN